MDQQVMISMFCPSTFLYVGMVSKSSGACKERPDGSNNKPGAGSWTEEALLV